MRTLQATSLASFAVGTKYLNYKLHVEQLFGRKVPAEHLSWSFLGDSLLPELGKFRLPEQANSCAGACAEAGSSCLCVMYQLFSQISAGNLSTNPVTLKAVVSSSLGFTSNLDKGITPALVNV